MKYGTILLLAFAMGTSAITYAGNDEKPITDERLEKMQTQLNLSDEQVKEMRKIRDEGGSRKEMRAVLNEDQKKQVQQKKAEREAKSKEKNSGKGKDA